MRRAPTLPLVLGLLAIGINASVQALTIEPNIGGTNTNSTAPMLSTSRQHSGSETSPSLLTAGSSTPESFTSSRWPNDIYSELGSHMANLSHPPAQRRGSKNNSMHVTNMSGALEQAVFGGEYLSINGEPFYPFTSSNLLPFTADIAADWDRDKDKDWDRDRHKRKRGHEPDCDPVPEPASLVMTSSGLMLLAALLRRRLLG